MKTYNIVGLIMAGGQSQRMGEDKATLDFKGRTFIETAWHTLKQLKLDTIFVCGKYPDYPFIPDTVAEAGPACAIMHAVKHETVSISDFIIVLPLDMPCLSTSDLQPLIEALIHTNSESVFYEGYPLPCALRTQAVVKRLKEDKPLRDISMLSLLTAYLNEKKIRLSSDREAAFVNINTTSDYAQLSEQAC